MFGHGYSMAEVPFSLFLPTLSSIMLLSLLSGRMSLVTMELFWGEEKPETSDGALISVSPDASNGGQKKEKCLLREDDLMENKRNG